MLRQKIEQMVNHALGLYLCRLFAVRSGHVFEHVWFPYLPHSSSASRFTAGASGFFILSQSGERPLR